MEKVRVRFAPSPTGELHLGGARTALFNFLFARQSKGEFILRLEDTDVHRSKRVYQKSILDGLKWLGLNWDEGPEVGGPHEPYLQSQRLAIYQEHLEDLKRKGAVYPCFCAPEKLAKSRQAALAKGLPPRYDGKCRALSPKEVVELQKKTKPSWRFRIPAASIRWDDLIKGEMKLAAEDLGDFIVMRSDGRPSYHLAAVVDDGLMGITHIIRGEDHLANTAYHIMLFKEFEFPVPTFAHLPIVLGSDRQKLSKRHGAVSIRDYREQGFLPEAVINALALLGWSPGGQEVLTMAELIEKFDLSSVKGSPAIFSYERLKWLNAAHIRKKSGQALFRVARPFLERELGGETVEHSKEQIEQVLEVWRNNLEALTQTPTCVKIFLKPDLDWPDEAVRLFKDKDVVKVLKIFYQVIEKAATFGQLRQEVLNQVRGELKKEKVNVKKAWHSLRLVLTGLEEGPPLSELLALFDLDLLQQRLGKALELAQEVE